MNEPPETLASHDGAVPIPSACPSSWRAMVINGVALLTGAEVEKFQVFVVLKVMAPPQGPKSVAGVASAPVCPRDATALAQPCWFQP